MLDHVTYLDLTNTFQNSRQNKAIVLEHMLNWVEIKHQLPLSVILLQTWSMIPQTPAFSVGISFGEALLSSKILRPLHKCVLVHYFSEASYMQHISLLVSGPQSIVLQFSERQIRHQSSFQAPLQFTIAFILAEYHLCFLLPFSPSTPPPYKQNRYFFNGK